MDVKTYRSRVEAEVATRTQSRVASAVAKESVEASPEARAATLAAAIPALIEQLEDSAESPEGRIAASQKLESAAFLPTVFAPFRARYLEALRQAAIDGDQELRARSLETLSAEQDPFAQSVLVEGLTDPAKALVPPEKALLLLAYDDHSAAVEVARRFVGNDHESAVREQAIRILGTDPKAAELLQSILLDKSEPASIRSLSAGALQSVDPMGFAEVIGEIILDPSENDDVRATCVGALATTSGVEALRNDQALIGSVEAMATTASPNLRAAVNRFLATDTSAEE